MGGDKPDARLPGNTLLGEVDDESLLFHRTSKVIVVRG